MLKRVLLPVKRLLARSQTLLRLRNTFGLCRVSRVACDASRLGTVIPEDLERSLTDPLLRQEWKELEPILAQLGLPELAGGVNVGDRRALYYLVRQLQPRRILEIGTHLGSSTIALALAAKRLRSGTDCVPATITTVDIADVNDPVSGAWVRSGARCSPRALMEQLGCAGFVTFRVENSLDFLRQGKEEAYDLIFLDGDHSAAAVYREVPAALQRLAPSGVVLLHDYYPNLAPLFSDGEVRYGVCLGVQRLRKEGASFDVLPLGALPWETKLGSCVTSLALVVRSAGVANHS